MGASQTSQQIIQSGGNRKFQKGAENRVPELLVSVETWTRESHGLYDFEGTEIQKISLKLKGSHRISRDDSKVSAEKVSDEQTFEESEKQLNIEDRDKVIARCLYRDNSYWIYHKNLIDENAEAILERKPEEKIWQVVKQIRQPEFEFPCYKMKKNDLVKVGRVRFKIRELMSPVYREINEMEDQQQRQFRRIYPSYEPSSVLDSINMTDQSQHQEEIVQNQEQPQSEDTDSEIDLGAGLEPIEAQPELDNQILSDNNREALMNGTGAALIMARAITKAPSQKKVKDKAVLIDKIQEPRKSCKSESAVCRICLGEEEETVNPLIAPCKCAGSMRFIHHQCLKTWFQNKRVVKSSNIVTTYFWKNLECELCKQPYPYETRTLDGRDMLNIIDYTIPNNSQHYIVLESISSNTSKVIHVVNMQNTIKLFIGRGHDAHVRVTDISVSRLHAVIIKSTQGYYYLSDNDSKFGTLALVRSPLLMLPDMKTQLQIGRSLLTVEIKATIQNLIMQCLCVSQKQGQQKGIGGEVDQISLDGINYFPKEFANESYIKLMANRQLKQMRSLKRKESNQKQSNHHHQTTQQNNESAALEDQVDQFINDQNELSQALLSADERQVQNQISSSSDEDEHDFEGALFQSQRSQQQDFQQLSQHQSDSSGSLDDGLDEEARQAQADDLEQLEQAIQESLALHNQQQQLNDSRTVHQSIVEEQKIEEEKSQIRVEPNEESKINQSDYIQIEQHEFGGKRQPLHHQDEQMSNISTSRQSQHPFNDLRSSLMLGNKQSRPLLDNDYQEVAGDRTIMHDMPTQLVPKAKANFLVNPEKLKTQRATDQTTFPQKITESHSQVLDNRTAAKTSRNVVNGDIASQVILEQGEELAEDYGRTELQRNDQTQTIEHKLPQSSTDVQPPNLS